jgi:manganese/zinc/iron transport system permease protein
MTWTILDTWIVIIGGFTAGACAIPGSLLVLRRMSLMGDAISHTVLPGIAIAFLVTGSREPLPMLLGAVVVGLLTAFLVQAIHSMGRVEVGASMGIVFTTLFAFGLVLMRRAVDHVDIDPDCVLYGAIELAWFDQVSIGGFDIPRSVIVNGVALIANAGVLLLFFKEFKISSFDPALAASQGCRPWIMHYLLMTMTAATAVAAFETVGSILVIAMFIVPAATAYLLTDRYSVMIVLAVLIGVASAVVGHLGAITVPLVWGFSGTSTAGAMAVATGVFFVVVWIFAPRNGVALRAASQCASRVRIAAEDVLGLLWRLEERLGGKPAMHRRELASALDAGPMVVALAMRRLRSGGSVTRDEDGWKLTASGRSRATSLVRSHRLWEIYLDRHYPQDAHQLHPAAERLEHVTSGTLRRALDEEAGDIKRDPHGREVP